MKRVEDTSAFWQTLDDASHDVSHWPEWKNGEGKHPAQCDRCRKEATKGKLNPDALVLLFNSLPERIRVNLLAQMFIQHKKHITRTYDMRTRER